MTKKNKQVTVRVRAPNRARQRPKAAKKQAEATALGNIIRSIGKLGGTAVGGLVGAPGLGAQTGSGLGALISRWLGQGDYKVSVNSLVKMSPNASSSIPAMHSSGQSVVIRHKEFLATINGSTGFTVQRFFLLQPGDLNTFPWLSGVANKFQEYRVKGLIFHYVPTSGFAISGTNPAIGTVMLQTSYRANDTPPATKTEMLNEYWASEAAPTEAFCHPIECDPRENPFQIHYVRTLPVPANDSPLLYDMGVTYVATQGMPANGNPVGDLWVTYEIELLKPQVVSNVSSEIFSGAALATVGLSVVDPFGTTPVFATSPLAFSMVNRTITFPIGLTGTYFVVIKVTGTAPFAGLDWSTPPLYTNCSAFLFDPTGVDYARNVLVVGTGSLNIGIYYFAVRLTDPSSTATARIPTLTTGTTLASTAVMIAALA